MNRASSVVYHMLAAIAMLALLIPGGLWLLVTLSLTSPPGTETILLILKGATLLAWLGLGWFGLLAWTRRSWKVFVAPLAFVAFSFVIDAIGENSIHWFLDWGY